MFFSRRAVGVASRQWPLGARSWARLSSTEAAPSSAAAASDAAAVKVKYAAAPYKAPVYAKPRYTAPASNYSRPSGAAAQPSASAAPPTPSTTTPPAGKPPTGVPARAAYQPVTIAPPPARREPAADEADAAEPSTIDWSKSFHGVSCKPVSDEQFKILMQPVAEQDIEVKPDGIIYLPEIKYRRRLNEAFGPMGWGLVPKGEPSVGQNIVTREYALIVDGRFVAQAQGENNFFNGDQLPSAVEGCKSNALMRCCKDLGIGSELWDPHFIRWFRKAHMAEVWVEHVTTKKKKTQWYRKGQVDVAYPYKLANGKV